MARLEEEGEEDEPIKENSVDDASGESLETEKVPNDPELKVKFENQYAENT